MTELDAGKRLRELYDDPRFGKVVGIHLFGIRLADSLKSLDIIQVVRVAGIPESYATEVRKGMALAPYVREI